MAITTLDGVIASRLPPAPVAKAASGTTVAGRMWTPFYAAGIPGAATANTSGLAGEALTSYAGQIPFPTTVGGKSVYLDRMSGVSSGQGGIIYLVDRLWHNSGIDVTTTTAQTINSVTFPSRDINGTTNGAGVFIGLEVSSTTGAGTPTLSMTYTNSDGVTGKTANNLDAVVATSAKGTFYRMSLADGDVGVRAVTNFTISATMTSGTVHLVAYRILATLELSGSNNANAIDAITGSLPICYDGTVPMWLYLPQSTTTTSLTGTVTFAQG
jgi:hypothetical protein